MVTSHIVTSHSHSMWQGSQLTGMRTVGNKVHSHDSNCMYSIVKSNGDSIEFSLSNAEQKDSWLNSSHRTLAADSCVFQEDWIVVRSFGEEWYRLIGVRIGQGEAVNDFNLRTKELGCNYWSTYTKSRIEGVQVISLHRDPIGVDNRSLGSKN